MKKVRKNPKFKTIIVYAELHKKMKIHAAKEQISLNELINEVMTCYLKNDPNTNAQ